jgi:hypothetical protein
MFSAKKDREVERLNDIISTKNKEIVRLKELIPAPITASVTEYEDSILIKTAVDSMLYKKSQFVNFGWCCGEGRSVVFRNTNGELLVNGVRTTSVEESIHIVSALSAILPLKGV